MEKRQTSVKAKLEVIQKTLSKLGLESGPAHLARIFGVAQSSIFRWLNDEAQPRGKQADLIELLYRTAREARAGNSKAEEILKKLISPAGLGIVAGAAVSRLVPGISLLSFGLLGVVAAAGLGWLLADKEDTDNETETIDVDVRPEENVGTQEIEDSREEEVIVPLQTRARRKVLW